MHDYLSCEMVFSGKKVWLRQLGLISKLEQFSGDAVKGLCKYLSPGTSGMNQVREVDKGPCSPQRKQTSEEENSLLE